MSEKPDAAMEAKGLRAYEQARAFERLRTWRLQTALTIFPLSLVIMGAGLWHYGSEDLAWADFAVAVVVAWMAVHQWRQLSARHENNLRLLREIEAEYGDQLSWVQVENHFAALEELKREIAEGNAD